MVDPVPPIPKHWDVNRSRWVIDRRLLRNVPEAKRLRDAAMAWASHKDDRPSNDHDAEFAFTYDAELLDAALAYAGAVWRELAPHKNINLGLRFILQLAEKHRRYCPDDGTDVPRGQAATKRWDSFAESKRWIESLPKGRFAWRPLDERK